MSDAAPDRQPLLGYHHLRYHVGNAKQAAHYYRTAFGFAPIAYSGPETGNRESASWVLAQGDVRLVLTAGLLPGHQVTDQQHQHGDGVQDVSFAVPDVYAAFEYALAGGAKPVTEPHEISDEHGTARLATVASYGDTVHTFVDASDYTGPFLPGYRAVGDTGKLGGLKPLWTVPEGQGIGITNIDHIVCNVPLHEMNLWTEFYQRVLGLTQLVHYDDETVGTKYTSMMSKVVWDGTGKIKLNVNEPAQGKSLSQIQEYLNYYGTSGVQHIAFATEDITTTVAAMREGGVRFMRVPETYYDEVRARADVDALGLDLETLAGLDVLFDQDEDGHLLQLFTEPAQDRPTLFYEVIERHGTRGFGINNFKALFQAIEREQAARGNL
ncbi:4-hydroxyphenylpyruvate dioxygenase [Streptomyces sp. NPDC046862]|uniref:4-hydroxyphenylpyruvate dioxygenase n=1 Tax=Streptomyces sp. NPDC046862 TaxID=3154603 RepID=UPI0034529597